MSAAIHRKYFAIWSLLFIFAVSLNGQDFRWQEQADSLINLEQYEAANEVYEAWRKKSLMLSDYETYLSASLLKSDNFDISEEGDSIIGTLKDALARIDTEEVGDSILALAYHKLGTAEYQVNNNDESAILYWQKALKIREDFFPPNHLDIIRLYRNLGHGFLNLEQREKSRAHFQKAVDLHLSREEKDPVLLAKTYNALAEIYTALQDFDQAEKYLKVALNDYKILFAEEPWELYYAYENVFYFDRIKENYSKMVRSQKEILAIYELVEDRIEDDHIKIANAYSNLGLAYSLMDSLELAFQYYKKSININERYVSNKEGALAINYNNVSNIYYRQKNYEQALKTINRAIAYDLKSGNQIGQATNLNDKATILLDLKKEDLALSTVEEAMLLIKPSDSQGLILDKPLLVDLLETKLRIFKTLGKKNAQYLPQASLVIDQMTALIDQIRIEYQSDASKSLLSRKAKPIFEQAIEVYLELYNNTADQIHLRKAFQLAERSKSIILMDALQQAQAAEIIGAPETLLDREIALKRQIANKEKALFLKQGDARGLNNDLIILNRELELLSDTLRQKHPAYHQAKYVDHLSTLEEIIPLVKERGLLEYFLGDSTLYAFLLSPSSGELTIIETPLDFPLAQWVKQLRENLYRYHLSSDRSESLYQTTADALVNSARRLYQKLIAPIASKTTLPEQLIIVPDGVLGYLPFELLIKEQAEDVALFGNHQYLLKDHQISYTYSAALLQEMQQKEHQTISDVFLAFAPAFTENPVQNKEEIADVRGGLSALLYNEPEARAIQKRLGGAVFTGMEATKKNFLQHAPNYKILHLSTHGKANDKVGDYSYLAFSPTSGDNAPDLLYNRELYSLRLNADMVVLSACETGIGELQKGEGIISLARGFAYAGAKSIVTSLWSANDRSTAEIMQLFYQNLRDGMSKDAALQQAKLAYLERQSDPLDAHPFYWATFVAVGDIAAIEWRTETPWGFILGGALVLAAIGLWRRRRIWTFFSFFFSVTALNAQQPEVALGLQYLDSATVMTESARYDEALLYGEKALEVFTERLGEQDSLTAKAWYAVGSCYFIRQDYDLALEKVEKALSIFLEILGKNHIYIADAYNMIAGVYLYRNDFEAGVDHYQKALSLYQKLLGVKSVKAALVHSNLGLLYTNKGDDQLALAHTKKALNIHLAIYGNKHAKVAEDYSLMGVIYSRLGQYDLALELEQKALDIQIALLGSKHQDIGATLGDIAMIYRKKNQLDKALVYGFRTLNLFEEIFGENNVSVANASYELGKIYELKNDLDSALIFYKKTLGVDLKTIGEGHPWVIMDYSRIADLHELNKDLPKAIEYYEKGITGLDILRKRMTSSNTKQHHINKQYDVFEKAIAANLANADSGANSESLAKCFTYSEKSKSNILLESLNHYKSLTFGNIPKDLLEKEDTLKKKIGRNEKMLFAEEQKGKAKNDSLIGELNSVIFDLKQEYQSLIALFEKKYPDYYRLKYQLELMQVADVQKALLANQTLVEYFTGEQAVYAFIVAQADYRVKKIDRDFPLEAWVDSLRQGIYSYYFSKTKTEALFDESNAMFADKAYLLYEKLIRPLGELPERLIIIPDDVLAYIPFEALLSERPAENHQFKSHAYLGRRHQISYNFSATLWQEMRNKKHKTSDLLAFAPAFSENEKQFASAADYRREGLGSLRFNTEEVATIHQLIGGQTLTGSEASAANFRSLASAYRILHFATHAKVDDQNVDYSYLAFDEEDDSLDGNKIFIRDLYNLRLPADMVVLSACETGMGELRRGEGVISLARGFAYAGAKSIVTSLWSANDRSTAEIMQLFYQNLRDGMSKDAALQQAKLAYLEQQSDPLDAHPFYWATFVAVGDMAAIEWRTGTPWGFILGGALVLAAIGLWRRRKRNG